MIVEIKIPAVGESVKEAILAQWYKKDGDWVHKDDPLLVIETDKVTLEIEAEADGRLTVVVSEGQIVAVGAVVGKIDTEAAAKPAAPAAKAPGQKASAAAEDRSREKPPEISAADNSMETPILSPSVRRLTSEKGIDPSLIRGSGPGGRVTKGDVMLYLESGSAAFVPSAEKAGAADGPEEGSVTRRPMSPLRQRLSERLLQAKQQTAMLTTFNEIDMHAVMETRRTFKELYREKYGVSLGIMSFFVKAAIQALKEFPAINASIDGKDIVYHHDYHIGIAVGAEKGLVVPVIRHADRMTFARIEKAIVDYVEKIEANRLELADLEGGTFTITNGGVYGSLLSTPILNMPQSGILGMHKIEKRPVVIDDAVVVRPMMYVALSYDHRIVDGREAVTFLRRIKECVENPQRMLLEI